MTLASIQTFAGALNQTFEVLMGESSITFTLVEVSPLPIHPGPGLLREPFSLIFRNASQIVLPQKLYPMNNATVGRMDIFIVPVGRDAQGVLYQAVFN